MNERVVADARERVVEKACEWNDACLKALDTKEAGPVNVAIVGLLAAVADYRQAIALADKAAG